MKKSVKRSITAICIILIGLFLIPILGLDKKISNHLEIKKIEREQKETQKIIATIPATENLKDLLIPKEAYLEVPFICQAPLQTEANWTLHEESCEEAALLQAYLYETGKTVSKEQANEIILDMIAWQNQNMGGHYDLYSKGMVEFITGYYSMSEEEVEVIYSAKITDIKAAIVENHPVIVPITGEILKNPYYPYPGYHMLTVIGYTEDKIITNDNGTRRGANFSYDTAIFEAAMKDAGGDIIILKLQN